MLSLIVGLCIQLVVPRTCSKRTKILAKVESWIPLLMWKGKFHTRKSCSSKIRHGSGLVRSGWTSWHSKTYSFCTYANFGCMHVFYAVISCLFWATLDHWSRQRCTVSFCKFLVRNFYVSSRRSVVDRCGQAHSGREMSISFHLWFNFIFFSRKFFLKGWREEDFYSLICCTIVHFFISVSFWGPKASHLGGVIRSSNLSLGKSPKMKVLKLIWNLSNRIGLGDMIPTPQTALKTDVVWRSYSTLKFFNFSKKKRPVWL